MKETWATVKQELEHTPGPWVLNGYFDDEERYFYCDGIEGEGGKTMVAWPKDGRTEWVMSPHDANCMRYLPELYRVVCNLVAKYDAMSDGNIRAQLTNGDFFEAREVLRKLHEEVY